MGSRITVRCSLCGKRISYKKVGSLGEHLLLRHPEVCVNSYTYESKKSAEKKGLGFLLGDKRKSSQRMYKTSVETWRPGTTPLKCLFCGKSGQPLIRKQRNKITQSSLGALCLLGCWPLCFLPFILGGSNMMNLYCKHCGEFLGTYDRKTGRLQPPDEDAAQAKVPNICECSTPVS